MMYRYMQLYHSWCDDIEVYYIATVLKVMMMSTDTSCTNISNNVAIQLVNHFSVVKLTITMGESV